MIDENEINSMKTILMVFTIILLVVRSVISQRLDPKLSRLQSTLFIFFLGIGAHALAFSFDLTKSSLILTGIYWITIALLLEHNFGAARLFRATGIALFAVGAFIVLASIGAIAVVGLEGLSVAGNFRGVTQNANYLATLISTLTFPYFIGSINNLESGKQKLIYALLAALSVMVIILTRSRTAMGAAVITLLFYLIFVHNYVGSKQTRAIKRYVAISAILFVVIANFGKATNKYEGQDALATRSHLIDLRFEAIAERPFIGWGFYVNNFTQMDAFNEFNPSEKGNTILAVIEEFGIIFGLATLIYLTALLYTCARNLLRNQKTIPFALILISAAVALQGETWLFNFYGITGLVLWLIIYLSLGKANSASVLRK